MKKALMVAAALSALSISSAATALNVNTERELQVQAFGGSFNRSLGRMTFLALGRAGNYCQYLANWESPYNPNDVQLCILDELRTAFTPSCIVNETKDITTIVSAGPGSHACLCDGFNLKGEVVTNVALALSEGPGGLQGVVIVDGQVPQLYPIRAY